MQKKLVLFLLATVVALSILSPFVLFSEEISTAIFGELHPTISDSSDVLRLHIRANSNEKEDQKAKITLRDSLVPHIKTLLKNSTTKSQSTCIIRENAQEIEEFSKNILQENGISATVSVGICKEQFPTREYIGTTLEGGEYQSVIVEIGRGEGDNWWCVAFPPLCYIGGEDIEGEEIVFKSKIKELLDKYL